MGSIMIIRMQHIGGSSNRIRNMEFLIRAKRIIDAAATLIYKERIISNTNEEFPFCSNEDRSLGFGEVLNVCNIC